MLRPLIFEWINDFGGLEAIERHNKRKSELLYKAIDSSNLYSNKVSNKYRSRMNVPFLLSDPTLDKLFVKKALESNLLGLKGHKTVGGIRASIYNSMEFKGVEALIAFMGKFEKTCA